MKQEVSISNNKTNINDLTFWATIGQLVARRLTLKEAAGILDLSEKQMINLLKKFDIDYFENNTVLSFEQIVNLVRQNQKDLEENGVEHIGIFGSYYEGEPRVDSDVDFVVKFKKGMKTADNFIKIHEILSSLLNKKIDLVTYEVFNKKFGEISDEKVFYVF